MLPPIRSQGLADVDHFIEASFFISADETFVSTGVNEFAFAACFTCHLFVSSFVDVTCANTFFLSVRERSTVYSK